MENKISTTKNRIVNRTLTKNRIWLYEPKNEKDTKGKYVTITDDFMEICDWNWITKSYERVILTKEETIKLMEILKNDFIIF